jgi:hypothetical protein
MSSEVPPPEGDVEESPSAPPLTVADEILLLDDILSDVAVLAQKETRDRLALESIQTLSTETLRSSLVQWAIAGFPNAWVFHVLPMIPPTFCSDGIKRSLADYVEFLTGHPMPDLMRPLQTRLPDLDVSFATTGPDILLVVSRRAATS